MKIQKNQTLWLYSIFITPGTGKSAKIRHFNFLHLSWPRVHESSQKSDTLILFNFHDPWYMKVHKNQTLQFYSIFMTRVNESWRKLKRLIFVDFHVHGVPSFYLIAQKWWLNRSKTKYKHFKGKKTCPLVTKKWTNQESEPSSSREWHKKPYAESFITIRPQIAKLWPKMVSPWWPKNEIIKKMTPPSVMDGKTVLTLWISLDLTNRRSSYDQKGAPWWPKNEL